MNTTVLRGRVRVRVRRDSARAVQMADEIGRLAEPGFRETQSAGILADYLRENGFTVQFPWPHMPTAFKATAGRGRPVIGLLAEYDALPDCGPEKGDWGHGCGHNLLGTAAAVAAVAARDLLADQRRPGRIVVWGCPAEELLAGKVYMARDGAFRRDNAILAWHPSSSNGITRLGGAAMDSLVFEFLGVTAHGAYADRGRSALDGVILLDVAANYLREHIPENVRIHMCIPSGGEAPNVVPAYAKAWYYVRGKDRAQVDEVRKRLVACARGAAMATGTRVKVTRLTGVYNRLQNDVLGDLLLKHLQQFGPPSATERDRENVRRLGRKPEFKVRISTGKETQGRASSDEDNVSWLAPFAGELRVACLSRGTPGHHRDYAAQMRLPFAHRGMLRAAEILAASAVELCLTPALVRKARAEFKERIGKFRYDPLIPARQRPAPADADVRNVNACG